MTTADRASAIPSLPSDKCYTPEQPSAITQGPVFPGATEVFYTSEEVSLKTKNAVSAYWLERKAREEAIPARKVGRSWRWTDADIEALAEYCRRSPRVPSQRSQR